MGIEAYKIKLYKPSDWAKTGEENLRIRNAAKTKLTEHIPGYEIKVISAKVTSIQDGLPGHKMSFYDIFAQYRKQKLSQSKKRKTK